MPDKRLLAVLTALMLVTKGPQAHGQATIGDLRVLENLLLSSDCNALYDYILEHPNVLVGQDALAGALRSFVNRVELGLTDCVAAVPAPPTVDLVSPY